MNATKDGPKSAPGFKYDSSTTTWDLTPNKPGPLAAINVAQGAALRAAAFSRDGGGKYQPKILLSANLVYLVAFVADCDP